MCDNEGDVEPFLDGGADERKSDECLAVWSGIGEMLEIAILFLFKCFNPQHRSQRWGPIRDEERGYFLRWKSQEPTCIMCKSYSTCWTGKSNGRTAERGRLDATAGLKI